MVTLGAFAPFGDEVLVTDIIDNFLKSGLGCFNFTFIYFIYLFISVIQQNNIYENDL